jgi:hypothetical protein
MRVHRTYWMWTQGNFTATATVRLNPNRLYLVTGGLVGTSMADFSQMYIWGTCQYNGSDLIVCGIRESGLDPPSSIKEEIFNRTLPLGTSRVTIALRSEDGLHRAEGVIYDIT